MDSRDEEKKNLLTESYIKSCSDLEGFGDQERMKLKPSSKRLDSLKEVDETQTRDVEPSSRSMEIEVGRSIAERSLNSGRCLELDESSMWIPKACSSPIPGTSFSSSSFAEGHNAGMMLTTMDLDTFGIEESALLETSTATPSSAKVSVLNGFSFIESPETWSRHPTPCVTGNVENAAEKSDDLSFIEYSVFETLSEISDSSLPKSLEQSLEEGEIPDTPSEEKPLTGQSRHNQKITEEDMDLSDISLESF